MAAMGTARQDVYDLLKTNLYQDDAVTGKRFFLQATNFRVNITVMFIFYLL